MPKKKTKETRVITMAINKGGTGKTTTALMFAVLLSSKGFKTLVIDNDPQRNASGYASAEIEEGETITLEDLYIEVNENTPGIEEEINKEYIMAAIQSTENDFDIIPCTSALASIENAYSGYSHLYTLKRICDAIRDEYDFIIIDNPPAANTLAGCGIVAADDTILPIEPSGSVEMSVENNVAFMQALMQATNDTINVDRIVITRMPSNDPESKEQAEALGEISEDVFGCKVAKPYIRSNQPLKKAINLQYSILESLKAYKPQALFDYVWVVENYLNEHKIKHTSFISVQKEEDGKTKIGYAIPFMPKKKMKSDK